MVCEPFNKNTIFSKMVESKAFIRKALNHVKTWEIFPTEEKGGAQKKIGNSQNTYFNQSGSSKF